MNELESLVTKKVLKMPVWVWLLVIGAGGGILYYRYRENQAAQASQDTTSDPNTAYGVSPYDQSSNSGSYDPTAAYGGGGYDSGFSEGLQEGEGLGGGFGSIPGNTVAPPAVGAGAAMGPAVITINQGKATTTARPHPRTGPSKNGVPGSHRTLTGGGHRKTDPNHHIRKPTKPKSLTVNQIAERKEGGATGQKISKQNTTHHTTTKKRKVKA